MSETPPSITEIAVGSDDFNILVKALAFADLVEALPGLGDITVFAPTDAAFTKLAIDLGFRGDSTDEDAVFAFIGATLATLGDAKALLTNILLYHVSPGAQTVDDINAAGTVTTALELGGSAATFGAADAGINLSTLTDVDELSNPTILATVEASNGLIQVIDNVLIPIDIPGTVEQPTITEIAVAGGFTILVEALVQTGLVDALPTLGDITVFAPTDEAFLELASNLGYTGPTPTAAQAVDFLEEQLAPLAGEGETGTDVLAQVLLYHVSQNAQTTEGVNSAGTIETLAGATFEVVGGELVDNEPDVANAEIQAEVVAENGVIQVIDKVLIPVNLDNGNNGQFFGDDGKDFLVGTRNDDEIFGFDGNDYLNGRGGSDLVVGGDGNDFVFGGSGSDKVVGGDGNDFVFGGFGDDELHAGAGNDRLFGGFGNDLLVAEQGDNILLGGFGHDTFDFGELESRNIIYGFSTTNDKIDVSEVFSSFEEILEAATNTRFGTLVEGENGLFFLFGVREESLDEDNFIL